MEFARLRRSCLCMTIELTIRIAARDEQKLLEDLQWRASLVWEEYREALLAHPDAVELPLEHLDAGHTYLAARGGSGFFRMAKPITKIATIATIPRGPEC